jgi:hypothetical protein
LAPVRVIPVAELQRAIHKHKRKPTEYQANWQRIAEIDHLNVGRLR